MKVETLVFVKMYLKYDDVMNAQREIIYKQRREVLDGENIHDNIIEMIDSVAEDISNMFMKEKLKN